MKIYAFFHLNLCFSSIEEADRAIIIEQCYWPLLNLIEEYSFPFGIELTGYTLELIQKIDSYWVDKFKELLHSKKCELIGSGYAQIIGPLVPSIVNKYNQEIGVKVYESLLDIKPITALVNEQSYSSGMLTHYKNSGYRAIIMEWDNPHKVHPEWSNKWKFYPQKLIGNDSSLSIIWNKSIAFQKFQRYVHGELSKSDLISYIQKKSQGANGAIAIYGNDAEIFNYRPGRFTTEAKLNSLDEWKKIKDLFFDLVNSEYDFIKPSNVLNISSDKYAYNKIFLETASSPVLVKKQKKYNLLRWAVSGKDDLNINTRCWNIYQALDVLDESSIDNWKELCYLWSSDFRTHITDKRWAVFHKRLHYMEKQLGLSYQQRSEDKCKTKAKLTKFSNRYYKYNNKELFIEFDTYKGITIKNCHFNGEKIFGTVEHGFFDDIHHAADFFSGHLVSEFPGQQKITDLMNVSPTITETGSVTSLSADVPIHDGSLFKSWDINKKDSIIGLKYQIKFNKPLVGSIRLGYITLNPDLFKEDIVVETHNGGYSPEFFKIEKDFDHGSPVSFLVSANHALGITEGVINISNKNYKISVTIDKSLSACVALVSSITVDGKKLIRLCFSVEELDDTSQFKLKEIDFSMKVKVEKSFA